MFQNFFWCGLLTAYLASFLVAVSCDDAPTFIGFVPRGKSPALYKNFEFSLDFLYKISSEAKNPAFLQKNPIIFGEFDDLRLYLFLV